MRLDEVTTLTRASAELGVTVATVRSWADLGRIRSVRGPDGRRLVLLEDIEREAQMRAQRTRTKQTVGR